MTLRQEHFDSRNRAYNHVNASTNSTGGNNSHDERKVHSTTNNDSWFVRIKLKIYHQFLRDIQYGIQMCAVFTITTIIGMETGYKDAVSISWLLPVIGSLLIADTCGATVAGVYLSTHSFTVGCTFMFILQMIGMGYQNYLSSTLLFFFTMFYAGYCYPNVAQRKIALLLPAVLFTTLITTPRAYITDTFVWDLLGECLLANGIAMIGSMIIMPRFACIEVHDRVGYTLHKFGDILELGILAVMAKHKAHADVYLLEAESLLKLVSANQELLLHRAGVSGYEPSDWLRYWFRSYQPVYRQYNPVDLARICVSCQWHMNSMIQTIRKMNYNAYHADAVDQCAYAYVMIAKQFQICIALIHPFPPNQQNTTTTNWLEGCMYSETMKQKIDEINTALTELQAVCDNAYHVLSISLKYADDRKKVNIHTKGPILELDQVKEQQQQEQQRREEMNHIPHHPPAALDGYLNLPEDYYGQEMCEEGDYQQTYDIDAIQGSNRITFSYFLFHLSEMIHMFHYKFHMEKITLLRQQEEQMKKNATAAAATTTTPVATATKATSVTTATATATAATTTTDAAPNTNEPIQSYWQIMITFFLVIISYLGQYLHYFINRFVLTNYDKNIHRRTMNGLKTAGLMGIALIFVEVPVLADQFEQGLWIMFAMLMSLGDNLGGTINQMKLRFLGTMVGAIYGYFVYLGVGLDNNYHIIAMLVPYIIVCGYIKQNKQWSYFGSISSTTALIVIFGRVAYTDPIVGDYSLLRIQQNALGIMLQLAFSLCTLPIVAGDLLKNNIASVVNQFAIAIDKVWRMYDSQVMQLDMHGINRYVAESLSKKKNNKKPDNNRNNSADEQQHHHHYAPMKEEIVDIDIIDYANTNDDMLANMYTNAFVTPNPSSSPNSPSTPLTTKPLFATTKEELQTLSHYHFHTSTRTTMTTFMIQEMIVLRELLAQQPLLIEQTTIESVLGTKPLPTVLYTQLTTLQSNIIYLLVSLDRTLVRISHLHHLNVGKYIILTFGQQVSNELEELLMAIRQVMLSLSQHNQLQQGYAEKITMMIMKAFENIGVDHKGATTAGAANEREGDIELGNNTSNNNNAPSATSNTNTNTNNPRYDERRANHAHSMQHLHYLAMKFHSLSHELNQVIFYDWLYMILQQSGLLHCYDSPTACQEDTTHKVVSMAKSLAIGISSSAKVGTIKQRQSIPHTSPKKTPVAPSVPIVPSIPKKSASYHAGSDMNTIKDQQEAASASLQPPSLINFNNKETDDTISKNTTGQNTRRTTRARTHSVEVDAWLSKMTAEYHQSRHNSVVSMSNDLSASVAGRSPTSSIPASPVLSSTNSPRLSAIAAAAVAPTGGRKTYALDDLHLPAHHTYHHTSSAATTGGTTDHHRDHKTGRRRSVSDSERPKYLAEAEELTPGAILHHLFDMMTSFNALFYATTQLALTTIDFSNILFTITEIEHKSKHNPF